MKKWIFFTAFLLSCSCLPACGITEEPPENWQGIAPGTEDLSVITDRTEYYDLTVTSEELFEHGLWEKNPPDQYVRNVIAMGGTGYLPVGTQFWMGEPVQLWAETSLESTDLYLYTADGKAKPVLQDISSSYFLSTPDYCWYLGNEGEFYCFQNANYTYDGNDVQEGHKKDASVTRLSPSGEVMYERMLPPGTGIEDFLQTQDGRIYLLLWDAVDGKRSIAEFNPSDGTLSGEFQMEISYNSNVYLGSAPGSLAVTGYASDDFSREIMKVDIGNGTLSPVLYFTGTSYGWHSKSKLCDFQVLENGSIELLWTDFDGLNCFLENLKMEKVEKIPIICRGMFYNDSWLSERTAWFNRENPDYHVVLEDCGMGNDAEDFARLTSVQTGAGKGPDILCGGNFLKDYIGGMLEKGALEELTPYLEASGIREEDYFPLTFASWRQGSEIYGVNYRMSISGDLISEEVLGSREIPDINALADALYSWQGSGVWQKGMQSGQVLESLLRGTDSLWGMVDWDNNEETSSGTCDFNTPLFAKLLEIARRYGDDGRKNPEFSIRSRLSYSNLIEFEGQAKRDSQGKVICGILFDDGCHGMLSSAYTMAVNANSPHKEGAWAFIRFLISRESQGTDFNTLIPPVHRESFEKWMQEEIIYNLTTKRVENGLSHTPIYYGADTSEEKQAEYRKAIEDARPLPMRTAPILTIILEEAEDYFNGSKNAEAVSRLINNRVQLYLDERK